MHGKLPTVIKEHNNMKRIIFLTFIAGIALLLPVHHAFTGSNEFNSRNTAPVPPRKGRKSEIKFNSMLDNSGKDFPLWMAKGKGYIKRKEYEQAILAFRKALFLRPADEEARFLLAWSYEKRGGEGLPGDRTNWQLLAEKEYRKAIELADHLPSRFNLAILLRQKRKFQEARVHLEHILLVDGNKFLAKKAQEELAAIFHQDMRPRHISREYGD
jgi:tetratricopeptide (TPR) repeat protein